MISDWMLAVPSVGPLGTSTPWMVEGLIGKLVHHV